MYSFFGLDLDQTQGYLGSHLGAGELNLSQLHTAILGLSLQKHDLYFNMF